MKKISVLLLCMFALAACSDAKEQDAVPMTPESPETRVAVVDVPQLHKDYIRSVFRNALPASVTDAQVDDVVEGYLVDYVHHIGVGYITENYHVHALYEGLYWPGPYEASALEMRRHFVSMLSLFYNTKDFAYLGMALHPIYDTYDKDMGQSCAAGHEGSAIFRDLGEWFSLSSLCDKRSAGLGYSIVGTRKSAIGFIYNEVKNYRTFFTPDVERLFNRWATNLAENPIYYEPCIGTPYI